MGKLGKTTAATLSRNGRRGRTNRALALAAVGALLAAGLTGCTPLTQPDGSGLTAGPTASATQQSAEDSGLRWPDGTPVMANPHVLGLARLAVDGEDYSGHLNTTTAVGPVRSIQPMGLEPSGSLVTIAGTPNDEKTLEDTGRAFVHDSIRLGRYTPEGFLPFTDAGKDTTSRTPRSVPGGSVSEAGIVWSEATEENSGTGWQILGVSPGSNEMRVLASGKGDGKLAVGQSYRSTMAPVLVDGRVYWNLGVSKAADGEYPDYTMYSVDFENPGKPRKEATDALVPFPGSHGVVSTALEPGSSGYPVPHVVKSYVPGTPPEEVLRPATENSFVELLGSDAQAMSLSYNGNLSIIDPHTRNAEMFPTPASSEIVGLAQCGTRISWSYQSNTGDSPSERYVYDRAASELLVVREPDLIGPGFCSGDFMAWSTVDPTGTIPVFETTVTRWMN